jgi:murein DD-endopeptidase MepM/ murein hydrolase activator NlpD
VNTKNTYRYPVKATTKDVKIITKSPTHTGRLKYAVDFIVPIGNQILASQEGIVVDVKQDSNIKGASKKFDKFGNYIEIRHKNGEYSIYEHIKKKGSKVKVGDKIKIGQLIGYSGNTGWIAHLGPHLHFDVHKYFGDKPEDYKTLKISWRKQ